MNWLLSIFPLSGKWSCFLTFPYLWRHLFWLNCLFFFGGLLFVLQFNQISVDGVYDSAGGVTDCFQRAFQFGKFPSPAPSGNVTERVNPMCPVRNVGRPYKLRFPLQMLKWAFQALCWLFYNVHSLKYFRLICGQCKILFGFLNYSHFFEIRCQVWKWLPNTGLGLYGINHIYSSKPKVKLRYLNLCISLKR